MTDKNHSSHKEFHANQRNFSTPQWMCLKNVEMLPDLPVLSRRLMHPILLGITQVWILIWKHTNTYLLYRHHANFTPKPYLLFYSVYFFFRFYVKIPPVRLCELLEADGREHVRRDPTRNARAVFNARVRVLCFLPSIYFLYILPFPLCASLPSTCFLYMLP
jgi:hypothetical protein